jgi:hypothetical protein
MLRAVMPQRRIVNCGARSKRCASRIQSSKRYWVFRQGIDRIRLREAYAWIEAHRGAKSVKLCCAALRVARPGYYRCLRAKDRPRKSAAVLSELQEIRKTHKTIGVWQMQRRLKKAQVSYRVVYRLYKENVLMAHRKPRSITKKNLKATAVEDRALRDFYAQIPMRNCWAISQR